MSEEYVQQMPAKNSTIPVTPNSDGNTMPAILAGMQPAFRHKRTGESHLSLTDSGVLSAVHGFAGLPDEWIVERDTLGNAIALHPDVVAGYWRDARFIALTQLAALPLDG